LGIFNKLKKFVKKAFKMTDEDDYDEDNDYEEDDYDEEEEDEEKHSWVDYALAFISGAAIGYGLYKVLTGGKEHYRCPNCNNIFRGKLLNCPYCNASFRWR